MGQRTSQTQGLDRTRCSEAWYSLESMPRDRASLGLNSTGFRPVYLSLSIYIYVYIYMLYVYVCIYIPYVLHGSSL